ncbi:hypothetical protein ACWCOP_03590 [Maricaulaceae bacterium MS644]
MQRAATTTSYKDLLVKCLWMAVPPQLASLFMLFAMRDQNLFIALTASYLSALSAASIFALAVLRERAAFCVAIAVVTGAVSAITDLNYFLCGVFGFALFAVIGPKIA